MLVRLVRAALWLVFVLGATIAYMTQPMSCVPSTSGEARVDPGELARHVSVLARDLVPRDAIHPENLQRAAEYIRERLAAHLGSAEFQTFLVAGAPQHNVVARAGPAGGDRIVVGAHYDAAPPGIGADDNASGVAGLIELARMLATTELATRVELVAFALEEPPYFGTRSMGSFVHADGLRRAGVRVRAMLSLEMIGYFRDEPGSQDYPAPGLSLFYPSRGNFIAVVGCMGQARLVRLVKRAMRGAMEVPVRSINAPRFLPGVDYSDQFNYWDAGFDAVMITDTAFYRNQNYHSAGDTPETLDYRRMAGVVEGIHAAVRALDREAR
jgi:Zn-dependent M28 family amino/carboxypeptidase